MKNASPFLLFLLLACSSPKKTSSLAQTTSTPAPEEQEQSSPWSLPCQTLAAAPDTLPKANWELLAAQVKNDTLQITLRYSACSAAKMVGYYRPKGLGKRGIDLELYFQKVSGGLCERLWEEQFCYLLPQDIQPPAREYRLLYRDSLVGYYRPQY